MLEKMIRKYYDEIFLYCYHRVGNRAAAEDLCQDTFVSFIEHYAKIRHIGRTKNYLYTIAGNKCRDFYRKNTPVPMEELPEQGTGACFEELVVVRQMISDLPDELREAIVLRYFQNLKYTDIASVLGINIKALLQIAPVPRKRGRWWNFVLEQIGYMGRYCLVWQAAWVALFWYLMHHGIPYMGIGESENEVLVLISLPPPILALLMVEAVAKVYQRSMLEIEYTTKYSLQSVVLVRMLSLCVFHAMILATVILGIRAGTDSDTGTLLVYGFTPMIVVTGILLKLMQCCQGEMLRGVGIGVYALTAVLVFAGNTKYFRWYQPVYFRTWCAVCGVGIGFAVWQFVCLCRKLFRRRRRP